MAKAFKFSLDRRIINRILSWLLKIGVAPKDYYLLTVPGRITGKPHSIPVALVAEGHTLWLVAPYGIVDWVKNAKASGHVELSRGGQSESFALRELSHEEAAPILMKYLDKYPITASYFNAKKDSGVEAFVEDAKTRPVFDLLHERDVDDA